MGVKNLKAIVVDGTKKITLADSSAFKKAQDDVMRLLRASPVVMGELGLAIEQLRSYTVGQRKMAPTENLKLFPEASSIPPSLK
jgi:aldehyde:ferredoxin oxidoreductase